MKRTDVTQSIKDALNSMPYHIEAWLYGSEARGDARADSDIDLLVLVDNPTVSDKDEDSEIMRTLTDEQRIDIVRYQMENAQKTLVEVESPLPARPPFPIPFDILFRITFR